jgi:hypothetical protein
LEATYIRYLGNGKDESRTVLPLRETGVMERRDGQWVVVHWHESLQSPTLVMPLTADALNGGNGLSSQPSAVPVDLSGKWDIHEEDKTYQATLDASGHGIYTWQGGRIVTTVVAGRRWEGTWHQPGNDREGGFQIILSEDHTRAQGAWWYTRVGDRANIPPREWGGPFTWTRLTPTPVKALTKGP